MSIIKDIFGLGNNNKFYARDFRNAYTFRPDQLPPRQKFQGYVNFVVNRALYADTLYTENLGSSFRLQLGSLVRTASLPEVEFKTDVKNAYNRKRIVNTGVEYQPVDIKVFDTINNEWLTLFMKYFSYHYMDPRSKQFDSASRDVGLNPTEQLTSDLFGSKFGRNTGWDSNAYGYNLNEVANFFERIDYVLYHGNKGVQYSLINPVLTRFRTGEIDYSNSDVLEFDMTFDYESFTIHDTVNFGLSEFDVARFEDARNFTGPAFVPFNPPLALEENTLEILGFRGRTGQPQTPNQLLEQIEPPSPSPLEKPVSAQNVTGTDLRVTAPVEGDIVPGSDAFGTLVSGVAEDGSTSGAQAAAATSRQATNSGLSATTGLPSVYGNRATFAVPPKKERSFIGGLLGSIADNALSAAIHGNSIKNAVVNTAVGGIVQGITNAVIVPVRGEKDQPVESSTAAPEKPTVTPPTTSGGGG